MKYIFTQFLVNGSVNTDGKLYIGTQGSDPTDSNNSIDVYTDPDKTEAVSGFGIDLDFNGMPFVGGQRVNLYSDVDYSMQIKDSDNANVFNGFISVFV